MNHIEAKRFLDRVKTGEQQATVEEITEALRETGDLPWAASKQVVEALGDKED